MYYTAPITISQQCAADTGDRGILSWHLSHSHKSITEWCQKSSLVNWQPSMPNNWVQPYMLLCLHLKSPILFLLLIVNNTSLFAESWWYAANTLVQLCLWNARISIWSKYCSHLGCPCFVHCYLSYFDTSYLLFLLLLHVSIVYLLCREHTGFTCSTVSTTGPQTWLGLLVERVLPADKVWILVLFWTQAERCTHSG